MYDSAGDVIFVTNDFSNKEKAHLVLIAGMPINEPVVQYGPFVMNTEDQIRQAMSDYRNAKNGFENARTWKSKTGSRVGVR